MNMQEQSGSDGMKITSSLVLSRAFWQNVLPSLPPHTLTPTATSWRTETCIYISGERLHCSAVKQVGAASVF